MNRSSRWNFWWICTKKHLSVFFQLDVCLMHGGVGGFDADLEKHNLQYPKIEKVQLPQKEHNRFLMIDGTVYILGDSLKDLGHSLTTVLQTSFTPEQILGWLR